MRSLIYAEISPSFMIVFTPIRIREDFTTRSYLFQLFIKMVFGTGHQETKVKERQSE